MDRSLVYAKTPAGEEATRQRTRVVQRNLRMVLLQVDGQLNVDGLVAKIGNESLVFSALRELEKGGYIALSADAPSVWEQGVQKVKKIGAKATAQISQISSFGPSQAEPLDNDSFEPSVMSQVSTFGKAKREKKKSVLETMSASPPVSAAPAQNYPPVRPLPPVSKRPQSKGFKERLAELLAPLQEKLAALKIAEGKKSAGRDLAPYKRKSWPLRIVGAVVGLIALVFLIIFFYPYNSYRSGIEASLGNILGMPVKIGSVGVEFTPRPSLALRDVQLGEAEQARIGTVIIPQLVSLSGSGAKTINEAELRDAVVQADFLASLPRMVNGVRENQKILLEKVRFSGLRLETGGVALEGLQGEIGFKAGANQGELMMASADRTLKVNLLPSAAGVEVTIQSQGWKPVENSPYEFSNIYTKGLLQPGRLALTSTEFGMAYGAFKGAWIFEWRKDAMSMAANGALLNMDSLKLLNMFDLPFEMEGRLSGNLVLAGAGKNWVTMWQGVDATLNVDIERGKLNGVDLGEAVRRGTPVRGGQTKFDRLKGELSITANQISSKDIMIESSSMAKTNGQFVAKKDKTLEADLVMVIQGTTAPIRSRLRVGGTLPVLQATVEK